MPQAEKSQRAKFEGVSSSPRDGTQWKLSRHVRGFCSHRNRGNTGGAARSLGRVATMHTRTPKWWRCHCCHTSAKRWHRDSCHTCPK